MLGKRGLVGHMELRAVFWDESSAVNLVPDADVAQNPVGHRHDRFADVKARKTLFFHDQHAQTRLREITSGGAARRAATDNDRVEIVCSHGSAERLPVIFPDFRRKIKGVSWPIRTGQTKRIRDHV